MTFRNLKAFLVLFLIVSACQDPNDPDVTETEIWRLELEQTDDGGSAAFRRRGTINLRLRLNRHTTRDPACVSPSNTTTFLADVETIASRLQP